MSTAMEIDNFSPLATITPSTPDDNIETPNSDTQPNNKRRRKKSIVWDYFTIETVGPGCTRAICNQCNKSFAYITGSKLAGTSHLKRHISLGICPVSRQKNQLPPNTPGSRTGNATDPPKRRYRASPGFASVPFDQDRCIHEIAKMIILHEYPLHIVEHPGFVDFVRTLQPHFNTVSFNTIQAECVSVYLRERQSLLNLINSIPGRVSLTLDLWTSNQSVAYIFLTGHFIGGDWNLHRRLLSVVMVPSPDSDDAFSQAVATCLSYWHVESKLFTLTLDQSFSKETIVGNLRGLLSVRNPYVLNGQLIIGDCYARVLSRLAQDALGAMEETIKRIRNCVKHVKSSYEREEQFDEIKQRLQVPSTKELSIDDHTRWNTTYHMLAAACELKEVFGCLETSDPHFKMAPSMDEWKQVEILCTYLKLFCDAADILTGPTYPVASVFYPEVSKIQLELTQASMSQDPFVSDLTKPLKEKFDKYWSSCFLVLAVAVVMDPRYKMKLVEFSFPKVYGEDAATWVKIIDDSIHELFLEYTMQMLPLPEPFVEGVNEGIPGTESFHGDPQDVTALPDAFVEGGNLDLPRTETIEEPPQEGAHQEGSSQEAFHPHPQETSVEAGIESISKPETRHGPLEEQAPQEGSSLEVLPPPETYTEPGNESIPKTETFNGPMEEQAPQEGSSQEVLPPPETYTEAGSESIPQTETFHGPLEEQAAQEGSSQEVLPSPETYTEAGNESIPKTEPQQGAAQEALSQEVLSAPQTFVEAGSEGMGIPKTETFEPTLDISSQDIHFISVGDGLSDFEVYISEIASQQTKSELDQYLEESVLPRVQEFDVLGWWKMNRQKYPTLSKMASDILSIPISTVAPDSVFGTASKNMDSYRSSLRPVTLEALVCAKDWLQYGSTSSDFSNAFTKMEF